MKITSIILLGLLITSYSSFGQEPELVDDFYSGLESGMNERNALGIQYQDFILLPLIGENVGEELGILRNGDLSILADIYEGPESSDPKNFKIYQGRIFFTVENENGYELWVTDGTPEGTEFFYRASNAESSLRSLTVARDGRLYYSNSSVIIWTNGWDIVEEIYTGTRLSRGETNNYCLYENGIAVLEKNDDDSFSIISLQGGVGTELARTEPTSFFGKGISMGEVENGLIFSIWDSNSSDGMYRYDETTNEITQLPIDGELIPARRIIDFDSESNICWIAEKGYYRVNGISGEEELLVETDNFSASQGDSISYLRYDNSLVFVPINGLFFDDDFYVFTDGTTAGTSTVPGIANRHMTRFLRNGKYAYVTVGISNNFQPTIFQIDLETQEVSNYYRFDERSRQTSSVRFVATMDGYLYFASRLNEDIGTELHRIKIDDSVNTEELSESAFEEYRIVNNNNMLTINSDEQKELKVQITNTNGQLIFDNTVWTNNAFEIDVQYTGYYVLSIVNEERRTTSLLLLTK